MHTKTFLFVVIAAIIAGLALPSQLSAQQTQYKLIDLGPSTGLAVPGRPLNRRGTLAFGGCGNPDCSIFHTFTWWNDATIDLGSGLSGGSGPIWISDSGLVLSNAANGLIDPSTGMPEQRGVLFSKGNVINIGTLDGGNQSFGLAVNDSGSVVGISSNSVPDPFSLFGFATQTRAVLWQKGILSDLGTLGGADSVATNVNQRGQMTGFSYTNATPNPTTGMPTIDPFLWDQGKMIDLGTLGGVLGVPGSFTGEGGVALNNRGQVAGTSHLPGDQTWHPFLWERGVLKDLGTLGGSTGQSTWINDAGEIVGEADLPGDFAHDAFLWKNGVMFDLGNLGQTSFAFAINEKGQVVGRSRVDDTTVHAFIWEKGGPMIDLNSLIPVGASLELTDAFEINERGGIAGMGIPSGCNSEDECGHAFLLIPCADSHCQDNAGIGTQIGSQNFTMIARARTQPRQATRTFIAQLRSRLAQRPGAPSRLPLAR